MGRLGSEDSVEAGKEVGFGEAVTSLAIGGGSGLGGRGGGCRRR